MHLLSARAVAPAPGEDDVTMADNVTRQEFTEYMIAFEKRLDARFDQIDRRFGQVDSRFDQVDGRFAQVDGRLDQMDGRLDRMDGRLDRMDERFDRMDGRLDSMDGRLDRVDGRLDKGDGHFARIETRLDDLKLSMNVQFEDVRRDIRFSLEAVQGLRETTEQGFAEQRTEHREQ